MDSDNEMSATETPAWSMLEFTFSIEDTDAKMVALCNERRVIVRLFAENFSDSTALKEKYLFFLKVAENFELENYTVEDFYDWIAEPLLPIFRQLNTLENISNGLEWLFAPETYSFTLRVDGDSLVAVPFHEEESESPSFGIRVPDSLCAPWPSYKPSEIQPCKDSDATGPPSPIPSKILLKDQEVAFLKLMRPGDKGFLLSELDTYANIRHANLDQTLRISRLLGLVRHEDGKVLGLLLTYVDCGRKTLSCASRPGADIFLRQKWAKQIEDTIAQLHHAGIVWGDAKPDNVLIDETNDAWLIDFGGSYTEDWVPKELIGTAEGDLVALRKIKESLAN